MTRVLSLLCPMLAAWLALAPCALAQTLASPSVEPAMLQWTPVWLAATADPKAVQLPLPAGLLGPQEVGPERWVGTWLEPLDTARVRVLSPGAKLRVLRTLQPAAPGGPQTTVSQPVELGVDGHLQLFQPAGQASAFWIGADRAAQVVVEKAVPKVARLAWESVRRQLLTWVREGGPMPAVPVTLDSGEVSQRWAAEQALSDQLLAADNAKEPVLREFLVALRSASIESGIDALRLWLMPYYAVRELRPGALRDAMPEVLSQVSEDGAAPLELKTERAWVRLDGESLRLEGGTTLGGALRLDVRGLWAPSAVPTPRLMRVRVWLGERLAFDRVLSTRPLTTPDDAQIGAERALRTAAGHRVGSLMRATLPLSGASSYRVEIEGGPALVRMVEGARRPWLRDAWGDAGTREGFAQRADEALGRVRDPSLRGAAQCFAFAVLARGACPAEQADSAPHRLAAMYAQATAAGDAGARMQPQTQDALAGAPVALAWWLRTRFAAQALTAGDLPRAQRWLSDTPEAPPADILPALLQLLEPWPSPSGAPSARLLALDQVRLQRPYDLAYARGYLRVFWDRTRWRRLMPAAAPSAVELPQPITLLVRRTPDEVPSPASTPPEGALWALSPQQPVVFDIPPAEAEPERLAIVRLLARVPPGRVVLSVDGKRYQALGSGGEERWELGVEPGRHTVLLEQVPQGAQVFMRAPRTDVGALKWDADLSPSWPVRDAGRAVRFALPPGAGSVRVRLRAGPGSVRFGASLFGDVGEPVRLEWVPGDPDPDTRSLDGAPSLAQPIEYVWSPPAGVRELWVEADGDQPLFTEVALRGEAAITPPPEAGASSAATARVPQARESSTSQSAVPDQIELWQLSRDMRAPASEVRAHLERAQRLLELGYLRNARADLAWTMQRAAATSDAALAAQGIMHLEELHRLRSEDYVRVSPEVVAQGLPLALSAGLFSGDTAALEVETAARELSARRTGAALPAVPAQGEPGLYAYLRTLAERAEPARAAALATQHYQRTRSVAWGIEACSLWAAAMDAGKLEGAVGVAQGVADELSQRVAHPVVRDLRLRAGRASAVSQVRGADRNAGEHKLRAWGGANEPGPWAQAEHALLAPPWNPRLAALIEPTRAFQLHLSVLSVTVIAPELWCGPLPDARSVATECGVNLRVDANPAEALRVPVGQPYRAKDVELAPGAHVIELTLDASSEALLSARFGADRDLPGVVADAGARGGYLVTRASESRVYQARPNQPVVTTVLGPASLSVVVRPLGTTPAQAARLRVFDATGALAYETTTALSAQPDAEVALTELPATQVFSPGSVRAWLTDAAPHRVEVEGVGGDLVVALATRRENEVARPPPDRLLTDAATDLIAPAWLRGHNADSALAATEGKAAGSSAIARPSDPSPTPGRVGLATVGLDAGRLDVEERDIRRADEVWYVEPSLAYRHRLWHERLFLMGGLAARETSHALQVLRPRTQVVLIDLPLGLRTWFDAAGAFQSYHSHVASQLRASLRLDGVYWVARHLALIPALQVAQRWLSEAGVSGATAEPVSSRALDPNVYSVYAATHRRALTPSLTARFQPYQDHVGWLRVRGTSNEDLRSWDQADVRGMWGWLGQLDRWGNIEIDLRYQPGARFHDSDRKHGYLRHDVGVDVAWCMWRRSEDRVCWVLSDTAYFSSATSDRNVGWTGIRYDFTHHRRLFDLTPADLNFDDLQGNRQWEGAPWQMP